MKKLLSHIRLTMTSGTLLVIPVFALFLILREFYARLKGFGGRLSEFLGLEHMVGLWAVALGTILVLLLLFYFGGLLVRFSVLTRATAWLEDNFLQFLPGYLGYKVKMEEKLSSNKRDKQPVLVTVGQVTRPGFLKGEDNGRCIVFIPNTPDINNGEVWIVDAAQVREINASLAEFKTAIMHGGRQIRIS